MSLDDQARDLLTERPRDEWLTVKEFASLKRVGEETVRRWIRKQKVEAQRTIEPHGHWRIRYQRHAA